jgi:hypothetical protein
VCVSVCKVSIFGLGNNFVVNYMFLKNFRQKWSIFSIKINYTDNRLRWQLNQIAQKSVSYFLGGVIEANYIKLRFLSKFLKLKERHIWFWHSIYLQYISLQWQLDKGAKKSVMIFFGGFIPANYWMFRFLSTYSTSKVGQVWH